MDRLLVPTDSQGLKCGVDSEVLHKPYLVFFNLEKCISPSVPINGCPTPQVCVEQCPNATMLFDMSACGRLGIVAIKEKLICNRDVQINAITTCDQVDNLITANQCARWYLKSDSCKYVEVFWSYISIIRYSTKAALYVPLLFLSYRKCLKFSFRYIWLFLFCSLTKDSYLL